MPDTSAAYPSPCQQGSLRSDDLLARARHPQVVDAVNANPHNRLHKRHDAPGPQRGSGLIEDLARKLAMANVRRSM
jgi:hypothetical protein